MLWLISTLYLIQCLANARMPMQPRIVNGQPTVHDEYPFMVSLRIVIESMGFDQHYCGGSLIRADPVAVLTAAHCVFIFDGWEQNNITFQIFADIGRTDVGENDTSTNFQRLNMSHYVAHNFSFDVTQETIWNDVAVIFFNGSTAETPVILNNYELNIDLQGEEARVIGYGRSGFGLPSTDTLEYADQFVINDTNCDYLLSEWYQNNYDATKLNEFLLALGLENDVFPWAILQKPEVMICAVSNTSACSGDSGGPLLYKQNMLMDYIQIGVVSWGVANVDTNIGCVPRTPSVYADVAAHYQWIQNQLALYPIVTTYDPTYYPTIEPTIEPTMQCDDHCDAFSVEIIDLEQEDNNLCLTYKVERLFDYGLCQESIKHLVLGLCDGDQIKCKGGSSISDSSDSSECNYKDFEKFIVSVSSDNIDKIKAKVTKSKKGGNGIKISGKFDDDEAEFTLCLKNEFLDDVFSSNVAFKRGKDKFLCNERFIDGLPCLDYTKYSRDYSAVNGEETDNNSPWSSSSLSSLSPFAMWALIGFISVFGISMVIIIVSGYIVVKKNKMSVQQLPQNEEDDDDEIGCVTTNHFILTNDDDEETDGE